MPCVGLFTLLGVLRSYVVARVHSFGMVPTRGWLVSVAAVVPACPVVATSARPHLASLARRSLLPRRP